MIFWRRRRMRLSSPLRLQTWPPLPTHSQVHPCTLWPSEVEKLAATALCLAACAHDGGCHELLAVLHDVAVELN